ncbi:MAG: IPT/TIG domain-containing protein [Polyangia bacterium]
MRHATIFIGLACILGCSKPPPKLTEVQPATVCQGGGTLTLKGADFQDGATALIGTTASTSAEHKSDTELAATFSGSSTLFTPGTKYDVTVQNPDGNKSTLMAAVTAVSDPILFFADPPAVYSGVSTPVTLYVTALSPPLSDVSLTHTATGSSLSVSGAQVDPAHPNRVLITVPMGTPAGTYDVTLKDSSSCSAKLAGAIKITDQATLTLTALAPGFGWKDAATPVAVSAQGGLSPTPSVYLSPKAGTSGAATALGSAALLSPTQLTAIVPKGLDPAGSPYDLIVVNPDGAVGILPMAYRSTALEPPVINNISPGAVPSTAPQPVTIAGQNFRSPAVAFTCITDTVLGTKMTFPATVSTSTATSITIGAPPVTSLTAPTLCTLRVTNGDDQTFADFLALAISNGSGNLSLPKNGTALPEARRAPAVVASAATRAARFLYAIGGDSGSPAGALDTVVSIPADENGTGAAWMAQRYKLGTKRTLAGAAALGRYLYVVGGNDGTAPVKTVERALVLDPLQAPAIRDVDITPGGGTGLGGGTWYYRVAALMPDSDADNPGGETLPSDVATLRVPELADKVQIKLGWTAVPGAAGYVLYRTPVAGKISGDEEYLDTIADGATTTYTDTGKATDASRPKPLRQGATGVWKKLPALGTSRESPGVAFGVDPANASKYYLYATLGRDTVALGSYEFLGVTVDASGAQTAGASWTAGTQVVTAPRYQHSIYSVTSANASFVPAGTNYIYLGGGTATGTTAIQSLEVAKIAAGGQLGAFAPAGAGVTVKTFGHAATTAANYLYTFGDEQPSTGIRAGQVSQAAQPALNNFNNNGSGLLTARYLPGCALSGALIYVVGGSATGRSSASTSVEYMIW